MTMHPKEDLLALAGPRDVTLYTSPSCCLCEAAKAAIGPVLREFGANLREVNVNDDPLLLERYGGEVPVIFIGTRKAAKRRVNVEQFRRQLQGAQ
jgi:glutaredoxin